MTDYSTVTLRRIQGFRDFEGDPLSGGSILLLHALTDTARNLWDEDTAKDANDDYLGGQVQLIINSVFGITSEDTEFVESLIMPWTVTPEDHGTFLNVYHVDVDGTSAIATYETDQETLESAYRILDALLGKPVSN
jgi:hypothetical protein